MSQGKAQKEAKQKKQRDDFDATPFIKAGFTAQDVMKVKDIFDTFDTEQNGKIILSDLREAINNADLDDENNKVVEIINDIEIDNEDEEVDFEQFLQIFGFTADLKDEDTLVEMFNQFDEDKDGYISFQDFQRISDQIGERYTVTELREMVDHADKDKDGALNFEDFKRIVTKEYPIF